MGQQNRFAPFIIVLALFAVLQVGLIAADQYETPVRVAKQFTKDYFYLDASMQDYLCQSLAEDGRVVDHYLNQKRIEAQQRGFSANYLRHMFTGLHLETIEQDDKTAHIHVSGTSRVAINPAFMLVGRLFQLGKNYPVDATLELVKEEDGWRVCGAPFGLQPVE
jgi:hypothetical protein